jgi:hypothetical protein
MTANTESLDSIVSVLQMTQQERKNLALEIRNQYLIRAYELIDPEITHPWDRCKALSKEIDCYLTRGRRTASPLREWIDRAYRVNNHLPSTAKQLSNICT